MLCPIFRNFNLGLQVWGWRFVGTLHNINVAEYNDSNNFCLLGHLSRIPRPTCQLTLTRAVWCAACCRVMGHLSPSVLTWVLSDVARVGASYAESSSGPGRAASTGAATPPTPPGSRGTMTTRSNFAARPPRRPRSPRRPRRPRSPPTPSRRSSDGWCGNYQRRQSDIPSLRTVLSFAPIFVLCAAPYTTRARVTRSGLMHMLDAHAWHMLMA